MIPNEDGIVVSPTEPLVNRQKFWLRKGKNKFNGNYLINQGYDQSTGKLTSISNVYCSADMIDIAVGEKAIVCSKNGTQITTRFFFYDEDKTFLSSVVAGSVTASIPENARYCHFQIGNATVENDMSNIQVEYDTVTEYEKYIQPAIFEKNKNGNYEKMLEENDRSERYHYTGTKIGTWVDGKPLYRKMLSFEGIEVTTDGSYPSNIKVISIEESNVDFCLLENCWFMLQNGQRYNMPYINNSGGIIKAFIENTNGNPQILTTSNSKIFTKVSCGASVIYTKTTD